MLPNNKAKRRQRTFLKFWQAERQEGLLPAGERQERDPDPEREYFHVLKLDEIKKILEKVSPCLTLLVLG
jgi:hypothetical protein